MKNDSCLKRDFCFSCDKFDLFSTAFADLLRVKRKDLEGFQVLDLWLPHSGTVQVMAISKTIIPSLKNNTA